MIISCEIVEEKVRNLGLGSTKLCFEVFFSICVLQYTNQTFLRLPYINRVFTLGNYLVSSLAIYCTIVTQKTERQQGHRKVQKIRGLVVYCGGHSLPPQRDLGLKNVPESGRGPPGSHPPIFPRFHWFRRPWTKARIVPWLFYIHYRLVNSM